MFSKFVGAFRNRTSPDKDAQQQRGGQGSGSEKNSQLPERNVYTRPKFLDLSSEDEPFFGSHEQRNIITPKNDQSQSIPSHAGYAECINGGKSVKNEDQAIAGRFVLPCHPNEIVSDTRADPIEVSYFCIFDGHAGTGAALMAADQLVNHLQEKLMDIVAYLLNLTAEGVIANGNPDCKGHYDVTVDSLIKGAIEAAFISFDEHTATERKTFQIKGGCTAIMALIMVDRLYVAHAGDCRAVAYIGDEIVEMSQEFTPETDAPRIQCLARLNPNLTTHGVFSENCYHRALGKRDIGTKVLYRAPMSSGWYCKTVTQDDVESPPLVCGRGKWARLMGVIGVTRGFGDHDLTVPATDLSVKQFMTAMPEIRVLDLSGREFDEDDVLVMGCDGLWDFIRNEDMQTTVRESLTQHKQENNTVCYSAVARDIVHYARGDNKNGRGWKMTDNREASFDDISAFVIPLLHLQRRHKMADKQLPVEEKQTLPETNTHEIDKSEELSE